MSCSESRGESGDESHNGSRGESHDESCNEAHDESHETGYTEIVISTEKRKRKENLC